MAQTKPTCVEKTEKRKSIPVKNAPKSTKKVKYELLRKSNDMLKKLKTKSFKGPSTRNDESMIIP